MDFEELLALLREPGEDGVPDTIYDDLSLAHGNALSTRDAKISELDASIAETLAAHEDALMAKDSEISKLKAANYDLLTSMPDNSDSDGDGDNDNGDSDTGGIDDLFEGDEN